MRPKSCYDLNAAIGHWQSELAAQPNLTEEVRRELEAHLRDAIAGFQQRGLNDEESFWLACKRVGQPAHLGEEFVKADPAAVWRERVFWMAVAVLTTNFWITSIQGLYFFVTNTANKHFPYSFVQALRSPIAFCSLSILSIVLLVWFSVSLSRERATTMRSILQFIFKTRLRFILVSLAMVFASYFLEAWNFWPHPDQYAVSRTAIMEQLCINFFLHSSLPIAVVALIAWLMPPEYRNTPKCA